MKRRRGKKGKRLSLVLLLILLAILFIRSEWLAHMMYPIQFRDDIRASGKAYKVEPHLLAAIIKAETNFRTGLSSSKGAQGLMQIMPKTSDWIIEQAGLEGITEDMLMHRADISITLGAWYVQFLEKQFDNNTIAVIAAYNAGPGNVRKWLNKGVWDGTLEDAKQIPFGETRHYVQKVNFYYNKYKEHYPQF